ACCARPGGTAVGHRLAARLCDPPLRRRPFGALRCPRPQRQPGANAAARPPPPPEVGVAGVVEGAGVGPGQAGLLGERADGEQSGVAGELAWRRLDDKRGPKKSWTWGQADGRVTVTPS